MAASITDIQKIGVSLSTSDITLEPGHVAQLVVTMTNLQQAPDRLSIEVEGVDIEWYMIPVPAVNVAEGASASERILFKIARNSANLAGAYPFLVRVQAMETGEVGVAQATLTVKPFGSIQVEISPKRALATFFHSLNDFDVSVVNNGNEDVNLQLFATDPDDGCAYEFDNDHITLKPGQSEVIPLAVRPKVSAILGSSRLFQFSATARSVDDLLSGSVHGQIEKRALISPLAGIFALLAVLGVGLWLHFKPAPVRPVHINSFTASSKRVVSGSMVTLSWDVGGTNPQIIVKSQVEDGQPVNDPGEVTKPVGVVSVKPTGPKTTYTLMVRGLNGQPDITKDIDVAVDPPPTPPLPHILRFEADNTRVHSGTTVNLSFAVNDCQDIILDPDAVHININDMNHKVIPLETTTYTLRGIPAYDKYKQVSKTLTVTVVPNDQCLADISTFNLKETTAYIGSPIHLVYAVKFAKGLHISSDNPTIDKDLDPQRKGSVEVRTDVPTVFTLKATDSAGLIVTRQLTVAPVPRPVVTEPPVGGQPITAPPTGTQPPDVPH